MGWGGCVPCRTTCRILIPQPGTEPWPEAVKVQSPNHWTVREAPESHFLLEGLSSPSSTQTPPNQPFLQMRKFDVLGLT